MTKKEKQDILEHVERNEGIKLVVIPSKRRTHFDIDTSKLSKNEFRNLDRLSNKYKKFSISQNGYKKYAIQKYNGKLNNIELLF
ncbi:MAG: hypothetical protein ACRC0S_02145 [Fusobacteriaceae bacterium]